MGVVPSKKDKNRKAEDFPAVEREPDYVVKTRSPMPDRWSLNVTRGHREEELRAEAMPIARRKCFDEAKVFEACEQHNGMLWTSFNCQEEFSNMSYCFAREYDVEMDKRRRDMSRHPEWWWKVLYDENGEVGDQENWDGSWAVTLQIKKFLGIYKGKGLDSNLPATESVSNPQPNNTSQTK